MYARSVARNSGSVGSPASSAAATKHSTNRRPRSLMSPLPACIRSRALWSAHSSVKRAGPPMTSAQYAASRLTCSGLRSSCEKGWLSSGSATQRAWCASASRRNACSPPAYSYRVGRMSGECGSAVTPWARRLGHARGRWYRGHPVPPPWIGARGAQASSTDSMVTLPSLSTLAVMPMLCDGSSALLTVQFSVSPSGSTRTVRPPASQLVLALTIWLESAAASICWLMFSSTSDTCTTLLSVVTSTLPLSSVCVTVNFTSWPSTVPVHSNVPPLFTSTSAGQLTS